MATTFDTYTKIKGQLTGKTHLGIDLCGPSAALVANFLYSKQSIKKTRRKAFKLLWRKPNYSELKKAKGDIITWNTSRADHKKNVADLCTLLKNDGGDFKLIYIADINADYKTSISLKQIWKAWSIIRKEKIKGEHTLYVLTALTYSMRCYEALLKLEAHKKISSVVAYNSSNSPECFVVAVCKKHNIPTFSLQHGLYHDYHTPPPLDVINYENVIAESLLVWSPFCKEEIIKFHARHSRNLYFHMPIAGYIKTFNDSPPTAWAKSVEKPVLLCLLPRNEIESSVKLLEIAQEATNEYEIIVRFHPNADHEKVITKLPNIKLTIDKCLLLEETLRKNTVALAVGFNTTSLFDTLLFQIPCALFNAPDSIFSVPDLPSFTNYSQLHSILSSKITTPDLANKILGANISTYAQIINKPRLPT